MTGEVHHSHRDVSGGWLRASVFGAMDGLVSNFALIAGVVGGGATTETVVLAGLAGVGAGAFSMAAGEYVSVRSQNELAEQEVAKERHELERRPEAELAELTQMYVDRGVEPRLARQVAEQMSADREAAVQLHAMLELGVDPQQLASPFTAALSSFGSFLVGALLPLLPYLLGAQTLWPAVLVAAVGLFSAGALVSRVTARAWWFSGLRQLLFGMVAAGLTWGIGRLVGVTLG
ncbi:MAG: VIT1/CCC1 transporter family protein [Actinomycetia bacterium]|jgi:VIT1/CCC1 family predicted Fe2+/Mn2+ transporter|nr:VIT1/CCC1 transporter family protein [Actinomycetes bacterium]